MTRDQLIARATETHDAECNCDRKYRMSCYRMAQAVLSLATALEPEDADEDLSEDEQDCPTCRGEGVLYRDAGQGYEAFDCPACPPADDED